MASIFIQSGTATITLRLRGKASCDGSALRELKFGTHYTRVRQ